MSQSFLEQSGRAQGNPSGDLCWFRAATAFVGDGSRSECCLFEEHLQPEESPRICREALGGCGSQGLPGSTSVAGCHGVAARCPWLPEGPAGCRQLSQVRLG